MGKETKYVWDLYPDFREWFQPEENPGVDPTKLTKTNGTKLVHRRPDGRTYTTCVELLYRGRDYLYSDAEEARYADADPDFMAWFQQDENPGVDVHNIKITDRHLRLWHHREDGYRYSIIVRYLFLNRDPDTGKNVTGKFKLPKEEKVRAAWSDPDFRKWFQPEENPGVDPTTLTKNDKTRLTHRRADGRTYTVVVASIYHGRDHFYCNEEYVLYADADSDFLSWFQPEENPGVDVHEIRMTDHKLRLWHRREDGYRYSIIVRYLFFDYDPDTKQTVFSGKFHMPKEERNDFAWADPDFQEWFQPEYNPGVDPTRIVKADCRTKMKHRRPDGRFYTATCSDLYAGTPTLHSRKEEREYVWDDPLFREWYQPEMNPGVDIKHLMKNDREQVLYHKRPDGRIYDTLAVRLYAQHGTFFCDKENWVYVWDDPEFREWFQSELNPGIDPTDFLRSNKTLIRHRCVDGYVYTITCSQLYYRGFFSVSCKRILYACQDEEIMLFAATEADRALLRKSAAGSHRRLNFICPHCGFEFQRRISDVAFHYPKCQKCKDTGFFVPDYDSDGLNQAYLIRHEEPDEFKDL